jgi:nucleoside-diphosphate-sugar epimerase
MNILVTGGAGYIGSILVSDLLDQGHFVTVVDNFLYDQASLNHLCFNGRFTIVKGDVRLQETIRPLLSKCDVVIPLAALVGAPLCDQDPVGAQTINHDSVKLMLDLISPQQIVLMPTTNSAYGSGGIGNFCDEDSPLNPLSKYAIDKVKVEHELMQHENAISFRLATVFGMSPRMRLDLLVNDFTYRAVKDKFVVLFESNFKRNYIHVRDVSRVFLHGLANFDHMKGQIYNVGLSDANVSKKELCEAIKVQIPDFFFVEEKFRSDPDQRNYVVSNVKLEKTGFKPKVSLEDGIAELIKGFIYLKNRRYGNV